MEDFHFQVAQPRQRPQPVCFEDLLSHQMLALVSRGWRMNSEHWAHTTTAVRHSDTVSKL